MTGNQNWPPFGAWDVAWPIEPYWPELHQCVLDGDLGPGQNIFYSVSNL